MALATTTTALTIGSKLLPELGGLFGSVFGNSRDDKRRSRQQYRDALISAGVRPSLVDPWHSDEHQAGQTLIQVAQLDRGVQFLNQNMPSRISRSSVRNLPQLYSQWINSQVSNNGGNSSGNSSTAAGSNFNIKSILPVLGVGGFLAWVMK